MEFWNFLMGFGVVLDLRDNEPLRYPRVMMDILRNKDYEIEDNLHIKLCGMECSLCDKVHATALCNNYVVFDI